MRRPRHPLALAAVAAALVLPSCGGDDEGDPIPSARARDLLSRLDEVDRRSDPLRCGDLRQDSLPAIENLADLPERVDPDVRDALEDGVRRLSELVDEDCAAAEEERRRQREEDRTDTTETEPLPTTPTEPPTDTRPDETDTQPTDTTDEPPPTDTGNGGQPGGDNGGAEPDGQ